MATAGYSTQYYNDSRTMMELQPTVLGDQPITSESKLAVLVDVGPELATAWIHLASWRTSLHFSDWNSARTAALSQNYTSATTDLYDENAFVYNKASQVAQPSKFADWLQMTHETLILSRGRRRRTSHMPARCTRARSAG